MVLFVILYKVVLTFEAVVKSNESFSAIVLFVFQFLCQKGKLGALMNFDSAHGRQRVNRL